MKGIQQFLTIPPRPNEDYSEQVICAYNGCTSWADYPYGVYLRDGRFVCPHCIDFFDIPLDQIDRRDTLPIEV